MKKSERVKDEKERKRSGKISFVAQIGQDRVSQREAQEGERKSCWMLLARWIMDDRENFSPPALSCWVRQLTRI